MDRRTPAFGGQEDARTIQQVSQQQTPEQRTHRQTPLLAFQTRSAYQATSL